MSNLGQSTLAWFLPLALLMARWVMIITICSLCDCFHAGEDIWSSRCHELVTVESQACSSRLHISKHESWYFLRNRNWIVTFWFQGWDTREAALLLHFLEPLFIKAPQVWYLAAAPFPWRLENGSGLIWQSCSPMIAVGSDESSGTGGGKVKVYEYSEMARRWQVK